MTQRIAMASSARPPVVISGSGLWTPDHIITNDELVTAYNEWANQYNARHAEAIAAGKREAKPQSSVEFIEKASGIKQRYA
jgi:beta-ketodecanoyl-[acyl-carrier-protein] synthase